MTQDNQLQVINHVNGTVLAGYGERDEVRELATRMMKFHPASKDVGETGMIAVAQLAILAGANPLPTAGEIHVWIDWRGELVVMLGVAYYRRKAREVDVPVWFVNHSDTNSDTRSYEPRPMTDEERKANGVTDGDTAAICKAYRLSEYMKLIEAGIPWQVAQQMITRTGIGVVQHAETVARKETRTRKKGDPIDPPHGRTWQWVAEKRAEQDVYRALSLINEGALGNFMANAKVKVDIKEEEPAEVTDNGPFSDMSLDEMNEMFFDTPLPTKGEPIEGVIVEDEETAVSEQPTNAGRIADIRADIESETSSMPLGDLIGEVVKTGEYVDADSVYDALKGYKFPARFKLTDTQTVTRAGALMVYDWLMKFAMGE